MSTKRFALDFPPQLAGKALTYRLVKDYDLILNILRAKITPEDAGHLVVELSGQEEQINNGIEFLKSYGVVVAPHSKDIVIETDNCIDCGACTSVCKTHALTMNKSSWKLEFDRNLCLLCGICVEACPVKAINIEI